MNAIAEQDVENFEAELEDNEVRERLRAQYFAVDDYGVRRMTDPEYARLFRTGLQAALDLQRSVHGLVPEGATFEGPREPTSQERKEWERLYFAVDPQTKRRLAEDPDYRAKCDGMRDRIFGTRRRDATGRVVG